MDEERQDLSDPSHARTAGHGVVRRARIVFAAAAEETSAAIARRLGRRRSRRYATGASGSLRIDRWGEMGNAARPHAALGGGTPDEAYAIERATEKLAA